MTVPLRMSDEVAAALAAGRAVVALETTLVSHGFSAGRGLAAALDSEERVRAAGAVPATVGVVDGAIRVGLDEAALERFAEAGTSARKVGARDIAACVVQRALGSTTVGGTLAAARMAGIRFLGTGGIGGVHRGFAATLDISADLPQIARTPAVVVCSGAKSILDVPATAELLETLSVPVLGWQTPTLPLFYTGAGGPPVSAVVTHQRRGGRGRQDALGGAADRRAHPRPAARRRAGPGRPDRPGGRGRYGPAASPVRRSRPRCSRVIEELSDGRSVAVNRALIADNAGLAAEIAVAYAAG